MVAQMGQTLIHLTPNDECPMNPDPLEGVLGVKLCSKLGTLDRIKFKITHCMPIHTFVEDFFHDRENFTGLLVTLELPRTNKSQVATLIPPDVSLQTETKVGTIKLPQFIQVQSFGLFQCRQQQLYGNDVYCGVAVFHKNIIISKFGIQSNVYNTWGCCRW